MATPGRVRDIPYSINYSKRLPEESPFSNIEVEKEGDALYIKAEYGEGTSLRDRVSSTDAVRLSDGEITVADLAYKHFAYLLG